MTITCQGLAKGPEVALSSTSVNFQTVEVGSSSSRVIYLENTSDIAAGYQLLMDVSNTEPSPRPLRAPSAPPPRPT
eukprot:912152-Prorocentrum_minimum.AAC.1